MRLGYRNDQAEPISEEKLKSHIRWETADRAKTTDAALWPLSRTFRMSYSPVAYLPSGM